MKRTLLLSFALFLLNAFDAAAAGTPELKVLAVPAVKAAMTEIMPSFERQTRYKVVFEYGDPEELVKRAMKGDGVDSVMLPVAQVNALAKEYRIMPDTKRILGRVSVAGQPEDVLATAGLRGGDNEQVARVLSAYLTLPETIATLRRNGLGAP
jgi:hypothetical protein